MQKYKKVNVVGKGSFGYAVLVQNKKTKKQYIMKIIDISKMDQKQIQQALMQVHLLKVMRYPYVVTYRESFMEKMCLCIVMDYCQGGDMYHKIAKQKQIGKLFPQSEIITWFVQMSLAMNYVHDKKILHRDLKTQNIFLTQKGDIKIGDFGIARVLQHTYDCANTAIGTPYYLSPEICQQKPYNQKSDIWSLGCIFYEIATLNHAFDAQNMKGLVQKILKGTYPPLPDVYSGQLKKLISQMLIKQPNKRPSIRMILEMPFMKAKVNELFSNTIKIHELKLQKELTSGGGERNGSSLSSSSSSSKQKENNNPTNNSGSSSHGGIKKVSREKIPTPSSINMFKRKDHTVTAVNVTTTTTTINNPNHQSPYSLQQHRQKPITTSQQKNPQSQQTASSVSTSGNHNKDTSRQKNPPSLPQQQLLINHQNHTTQQQNNNNNFKKKPIISGLSSQYSNHHQQQQYYRQKDTPTPSSGGIVSKKTPLGNHQQQNTQQYPNHHQQQQQQFIDNNNLPSSRNLPSSSSHNINPNIHNNYHHQQQQSQKNTSNTLSKQKQKYHQRNDNDNNNSFTNNKSLYTANSSSSNPKSLNKHHNNNASSSLGKSNTTSSGKSKSKSKSKSSSNSNSSSSSHTHTNTEQQHNKISVYEEYQEEETLQEQGYGVLLRDMKRCLKGGQEGSEEGDEQERALSNGKREEAGYFHHREDNRTQPTLATNKQRHNHNNSNTPLNNMPSSHIPTPNYLKLNKVPGISQRDTIGSKIQALRDYLQRQIGDEFFTAYKMMIDSQIEQKKANNNNQNKKPSSTTTFQDDDDSYCEVRNLLRQKSKFIPLILQLIVCEDSYY